ncbi:hypothetical protein [Paenarthrobacter sp. NCHU4564]|uniref:hypothetical protein n=1 Tax=Paenarthrobacter sp. NCHU4564 TaxID=3451353 RepID=UPI003F9E30EE
MASIRSRRLGRIQPIHRRGDRSLSTWGWTVPLPLLVLAVAGCSGASGASAIQTSAVTSSASGEPRIQQAYHSCQLDRSTYSAFAILGDDGHTITLKGEPEDPNWVNITKVTGLSAKQMACVLTAVSVPDSVLSEIDATRALDGMQRSTWNKISASWTYHPDHGLRLVLNEAK